MVIPDCVSMAWLWNYKYLYVQSFCRYYLACVWWQHGYHPFTDGYQPNKKLSRVIETSVHTVTISFQYSAFLTSLLIMTCIRSRFTSYEHAVFDTHVVYWWWYIHLVSKTPFVGTMTEDNSVVAGSFRDCFDVAFSTNNFMYPCMAWRVVCKEPSYTFSLSSQFCASLPSTLSAKNSKPNLHA